MGCCDFELEEASLYRLVARVKNQYRTGTSGPLSCHLCQTEVGHAYVKKNWIGFTVHIACTQCGWSFEG